MIKNYIYLGAPGVGKGTVASMIQENKGIIHISTGEMFRAEMQSGTELGLKVKEIVEAGNYVPDDITNQVVKNRLSMADVKEKGFILDGYPRTLNQAKFIKENKIIVNGVILLEASDEMVMERLLGRKRADDTPEIIATRINVYNEKTRPLIDYYESEEILIRVDASGSIDQNFENVLKVTT